MRTFILIFGLLFFHSIVLICQSQNLPCHDSANNVNNLTPYGLNPKEWHNVQKIWTRKNSPVRVQLANDSLVYGQILSLNDTALILWSDVHSFFNPYSVDSQLTIIDRASFRDIFDHSGFSREWWEKGIFLGTIGGAVIGTAYVIFVGQGWVPFYFALVPAALGTGIGYLIDDAKEKKLTDDSVPPLNYDQFSDKEKEKFYVFPDGLTESMSYTNHYKKWDPAAIKELTFDDILAISPHAKRIFRTTKYSIAGQYFKSLPAFNYRKTYYFQPGFGLSARVNLTNWLNTGYNFRRILYYNYNAGDDYFPEISGYIEQYTLNNTSNTLFFQYAPITPDRFLTRRYEISAGIGASLNMLNFQLEKMEVFNSLAEFGGEAYEGTLLYEEHINKLSAGLVLLADFDYYLSKTVSLNLNVEQSLIRDLKTEKKTVIVPRTGETVTFESQEINLSSISYSLGIRLHF